MAELLAVGVVNFVMAFGVVVALDLLRRVFGILARGLRRLAHAAPQPPGDTFLTALFTYFLYPFVAIAGFIPPLTVLTAVAVLLGADRKVMIGMFPNGMMLLWTLTVAFLWLQVWYLLSLPGFGRRIRYVVLLLALPLLAQILAWLCLDFLSKSAYGAAFALPAVRQLAHLAILGVFPFLMPLVHARWIAPLFAWASALPSERWRPAVTGIGTALLFAAVLALFVWFGFTAGTNRLAGNAPAPRPETAPAAIGIPHSCVEQYPAASVRAGEQGATVLAFRITTIGTVKDIEIAKSSGYDRLDAASVICVSRWSYIPATAHGRAVETPWKAQIVWVLH